MINDLKILSPGNTGTWKFMDDVSISESLSRNSESRMQNHLDEVNTWADNNIMKLNPKKCKEMHVFFLKEQPILERLNLRGHPLEIAVSSPLHVSSRFVTRKLVGLILATFCIIALV
jgi:hypothetical protein